MRKYTLDTTKIDERLIWSISRMLCQSKIPCILWGNCLLTVWGVPSIVDSIDFVIPDKCVAASVLALQGRGLAHCRNPKTCSVVNRPRPTPLAMHFHITDERTVNLYRQSSTLWFLPALDPSREPNSNPLDFIMASDARLPGPRPGRGRGAFPADSFPVFIPTAHRLLEAYIRLMLRADGTIQESFWLAMITYIWEYVDGDGYLDGANLETRCGQFYYRLKSSEKPLSVLFEELAVSFAGEN